MEHGLIGHLRKVESGRWIIAYKDSPWLNYELWSGDFCELEIAGHWIKTRIEISADGHYYAIQKGIYLCEGLPARRSER